MCAHACNAHARAVIRARAGTNAAQARSRNVHREPHYVYAHSSHCASFLSLSCTLSFPLSLSLAAFHSQFSLDLLFLLLAAALSHLALVDFSCILRCIFGAAAAVSLRNFLYYFIPSLFSACNIVTKCLRERKLLVYQLAMLQQ